MSIALGIIAGIYLLGFITMIVSIICAPEGREDETGFHAVWVNRSSGLRDIRRLWS